MQGAHPQEYVRPVLRHHHFQRILTCAATARWGGTVRQLGGFRQGRARGLALFALLALVSSFQIPAAPSAPKLRLRGGDIDPRAETVAADPATPGRVVLVQGDGDPAVLRAALVASGATVLAYVPDGAWLVRTSSAASVAPAALPEVRWTGAPRAEWKVSPDLGGDVYLKLGNIRLRRNERDEAVRCWERALELDPQNAIVRTNLGAVRQVF